jgi:hypothetical protein
LTRSGHHGTLTYAIRCQPVLVSSKVTLICCAWRSVERGTRVIVVGVMWVYRTCCCIRSVCTEMRRMCCTKNAASDASTNDSQPQCRVGKTRNMLARPLPDISHRRSRTTVLTQTWQGLLGNARLAVPAGCLAAIYVVLMSFRVLCNSCNTACLTKGPLADLRLSMSAAR